MPLHCVCAYMCVFQWALSTLVWGMQCGLGASSQADRLCLQRWRGRGGQARGLQIHRSSSLFALQWFSHQTRLLNQGPPLNKDRQLCPHQMPPPPPWSLCVPTRVLSFGTLFYLASTLFSLSLSLSCFDWLLFPGLSQMGKHYVASVAFSWCLTRLLWRMKKGL